jgi:signal peptidase I
MRFVYALASLLYPGLGQALAGHRRAAFAWIAALVVTLATVALTVWTLLIVAALYLANVVHAFIVAGEARPRRTLDIVAVVIAPIVAAMALRGFVVEAFEIPSSSMSPTFEVGDRIFINKLARTPSRGDVVVFRQPCFADERDYVARVIGLPGDTIEVRCDVVYVNRQATRHELLTSDDSYDDEYEGRSSTHPASRWRETVDGTSIEVFHAAERATTAGPSDHDFPTAHLAGASCAASADTGFGDGTPPGLEVGKVEHLDAPNAMPCDQQAHYIVPQGQVFVLGDNRDNSNDSRYWGGVPTDHIKGRVVGVWFARHMSRFGAR